MKYLLILLFCLRFTFSAVEKDLITDPQLIKETKYEKPWYSGYFNISTQKSQMNSHYFFFPSQTNPDTDPLVLWISGGPGCSSLISSSQENGPWIFETNSTNIKLNPHSWNMKANILYLESPPGVGFSTTDDYNWDDTQTAEANVESLRHFFNSYEEYRDRDFYIATYSYGGIYAPYLARDILLHNKQVSSSQKINLKGFIIGNGCTDPTECFFNAPVNPFFWLTFAQQGYFTSQQQKNYYKYCGSPNEPDLQKLKSNECAIHANLQLYSVTPGVDAYNLIGYCYHQNLPNQNLGNMQQKQQEEKLKNLLQSDPQLAKEYGIDTEYYERRNLESNEQNLPDCIDAIGPMTFFNQDYVKKALHVDTNINWEMCNDPIFKQYKYPKDGSYYLHPNLVENNLRIWIYSGNTDSVVATSGTLYWFSKLVKEQNYATTVPWRAWYTEGQQPGNRQNAGQYWATEGLTVITFKGCGHGVPPDNQVGAYDMINAFLEGNDLPPY